MAQTLLCIRYVDRNFPGTFRCALKVKEVNRNNPVRLLRKLRCFGEIPDLQKTLYKGINMSDLCKCTGKNCKKKENCLRYNAPTDPYYQAFFTNAPIDEKGKCEYYIKSIRS